MKLIPFNNPKIIGNEIQYIKKSFAYKQLSGDGYFSKKSTDFFKKKYGFKNCFLTSSCTDALEMISVIVNFNKYDEIIVPSYSFVSCANAFETHGAKIIFADVENNFPNISYDSIKNNISEKTRAILVVHYAGFSCEIDKIKKLCIAKNILLIEDCAHSIDSKYKNKFLGSFGDFSTFSFHDTKNITCGEGGLLVVNNNKYLKKASFVYHKGTNRSDFNKKFVTKYQWVEMGASYVMSEISAAFLFAQLEKIDKIQKKRVSIVNQYILELEPLFLIRNYLLTSKFNSELSNGHIFFLTCKSKSERNKLLEFLSLNNVHATFHYLPLHKSKYFERNYKKNIKLVNSESFSNRIIRLPIFYDLSIKEIKRICYLIHSFFVKYP